MRPPVLLAILALVITPLGAAAGDWGDQRNEAYFARERLRSICMQHRLDREGALRAADADGWTVLSDGQLPTIGGLGEAMKRLKLTGAAVRSKASPRGQMVLLLGDGGETGPACAIGYQGPFDTASSVIGGHFMLPIKRFEEISPTHHLWAFVEEPGKRRRAVKSYFGKIDHALIASSRAAQTFSTIEVIGDPHMSGAMFIYSVPPPTAPEV